MTTNQDAIVKSVVLEAPLERVWNAVSQAAQFGRWFGMKLEGTFVAGVRIHGVMKPTEVDQAVAKLQEPFAGKTVHLDVVTIEPMRVFAFRWHPGEMKTVQTLVTFDLEREGASKTRLTITESGFSKVPEDQRASLFAGNAEGWSHQCQLIAAYLARVNQ